MLKWYQWYVIGRFCNLFCLLHCRNWKSMALMSVCNCVISVKKCFLSPNNGFLRFCQGKTQVPIKNYILNSTNRITTVLCQKCLAQQAHIIRASTLHPSSTILLLSYIFLCEQKNVRKWNYLWAIKKHHFFCRNLYTNKYKLIYKHKFFLKKMGKLEKET